MKRTAFRRAALPRRPVKTIDYAPRPRSTVVALAVRVLPIVPVPKREYVRDEDYRRWVASLACMHCGIKGFSQAAHADDNGAGGKGMSIKASDDTCYPACGPHLLPDGSITPGCHWLIGTSGRIPKDERRALELNYSALTRAIHHQETQHA